MRESANGISWLLSVAPFSFSSLGGAPDPRSGKRALLIWAPVRWNIFAGGVKEVGAEPRRMNRRKP